MSALQRIFGQRRRHRPHSPWLFALWMASGCGPSPRTASCGPEAPPCASNGRITSEHVVAQSTHDTDAFTQGLIWREGRLWESTGLYGQSDLRRWHPDTGAIEVEQALPADLFGEGLAWDSVRDRLVQLTWKEGVARVYSPIPALTTTFTYDGEGWGLCFDGTHFFMSDGSSRLTRRDADTFAVVDTVEVTWRGASVEHLNELECAEGMVWANRWLTDEIYRIDPSSGEANARWVVEGLLTAEQEHEADVLNGLVWDPTRRRLGITGKLWPLLFWVNVDALPAPTPG